jgi:hypothetical protein
MPAEKVLHISVSQHYFRLTTEGIRLFSNKHNQHCSFGRLIDERAERAVDLSERYEAQDLREHLRIIPTDGDVELEFTILETSADSIETAAAALGEAIGRSLLFPDAVSLMLFDLVVERNATEVLTKLGLTSSEAAAYRVALKRKETNVIPFRP